MTRRIVCGLMVVLTTTLASPLREAGLQPLGPLIGVVLIAASLLGDVSPSVAWAQRLGAWLFPGILAATLAYLLPMLTPAPGRESSILAFSPAMWAAYAPMVLVSLSFELGSLPARIHRLCKASSVTPARLVPAYVVIAGILGNVLDGVSIIAISAVVFLSLLPMRWALRAAFALLSGGLVSNLITVAAEPTNIAFQSGLHPLLDTARPDFWLGNWPISVLGIAIPALALGLQMRVNEVAWRPDEPAPEAVLTMAPPGPIRQARSSAVAVALLGAGITGHALIHAAAARGPGLREDPIPLWLLLLPAGIVALADLVQSRGLRFVRQRLAPQWPVWTRLMVIFSLLWILTHGLGPAPTVLTGFFALPAGVTFGGMVGVSLISAVTDNVAIAAVQCSLILHHPLPIWQVRVLFVLLTWSGGFTPFGCLQSLALNGRLSLTPAQWFREAHTWSALALLGGMAGLLFGQTLYAGAAGGAAGLAP